MMFHRKNKIKKKLLQTFGEFKIETFDFEQIEKYFRGKQHSDDFQVLSDKMINDLDLHELFMFIDRTTSKVGQQYLYNKLRTIPLSENDNSCKEKIIDLLTIDPEFRVSVQGQLTKLSESEAFYITSLFQDEHLKPPKWFFVVRLLSFASLLSLILIFFNPINVFILLTVFIVNLVIHYWNKRNLYQYLGSIPQFLILNGIAHELFKNESLKKLNCNLSESLRTMDKMRNRMLFFKLEAKLQGDLEAIFWGMLELLKILFLLEPLLLFGVLKQLDTKRKEIEDVFEFVGKTDALVSIASLRKSTGKWCIPTINSGGKILDAEDVYHPLINDCITNSIHVDQKSILLTGSNMSGKTSFIRTIGINVISGLSLNTCFAEHFLMPRMRIFSAIRISDDLMNDRSYYFEEVLTIKEMIVKSQEGKPNLFLLDEIFKGTNTVERIAAGKAVLSSLSKSGNMVFVSTHDIELADLLKDEYGLYHFSEQVDHKTVDFDYKLKSGKLKNRNAIRILEINDYPKKIIEEAIKISKELDKYYSASKQTEA